MLDSTCYPCYSTCGTCYAAKANNCVTCVTPNLFENGYCVSPTAPGCGQYATSNGTTCVTSTTCTATNCTKCSTDPNFCVTCNSNTTTPIVDIASGTCVNTSAVACSAHFYVDNTTQSCKLCDWGCKDCELNKTNCFECWSFFTGNILNWVNFTCGTSCPNGTYYDKTLNQCPTCNPVCLTCSGGYASNCTSCNATDKNVTLYLYNSTKECVLNCPLPYTNNESTHTCDVSNFSFLNIPFYIILALTIISILTAIISKVVALIRKK